jgi:hypothetical protein
MTKFYINKNPAGKLSNLHFGVCQLADGSVRVLTLGFVVTTFALDQARNTARARLEQLKGKRTRWQRFGDWCETYLKANKEHQ